MRGRSRAARRLGYFFRVFLAALLFLSLAFSFPTAYRPVSLLFSPLSPRSRGSLPALGLPAAEARAVRRTKSAELPAPSAPPAPETLSFPGAAEVTVSGAAYQILAEGGKARLEIPEGAFPRGGRILFRAFAPVQSAALADRALAPLPVYLLELDPQPQKPLVLTLELTWLRDSPESDPRLFALWRQTGEKWQPAGGRLWRDEGGGARWKAYVRASGRYGLLRPPLPFQDLWGHWAEKAVDLLHSRGIVTGEGPRFEPERPLTRAELAALIARTLLCDDRRSGESLPPLPPFRDVPERAWFREHVALLVSHGIIKGEGDRFRPQDPVSRQELAVVLSRFPGVEALGNPPPSPFPDQSQAGEWARPALESARARGILRGDPDGLLRPRSPVTRAEAAVALARLLDRIGYFEELTEAQGRLEQALGQGAAWELLLPDQRRWTLLPAGPDVESLFRQGAGGSFSLRGYLLPREEGVIIRVTQVAAWTSGLKSSPSVPSRVAQEERSSSPPASRPSKKRRRIPADD